MHHDSQPYYLRLNDTWKKINYDQPAATWMEPVKRGETTGMVEIPVNWEVSAVGWVAGVTTDGTLLPSSVAVHLITHARAPAHTNTLSAR
jgi:hypothetical protein